MVGSDPTMERLVADGDPLLPALIDAERFTYQEAAGFLACGPAIVDEIETGYGVEFGRTRSAWSPTASRTWPLSVPEGTAAATMPR